MKIIIHYDILEKILIDEKDVTTIFQKGLREDVKFISGRHYLEQLISLQGEITEVRQDLWQSNLQQLKERVDFHQKIEDTTYFQDLQNKISDSPLLWTIALANDVRADIIWTDLKVIPDIEISTRFFSTKQISRDFEESFRIFLTESQRRTIEAENENYSNYGEKSKFKWLTDNRLDPMFYQRFLHFYGLKCLNDGKIYYLNPEGSKLSLPNILTEIKEEEKVYIISREDNGNDDTYAFFLNEVIISKWYFYWQLFLHEGGPKGYSQVFKEEDTLLLVLDKIPPKKTNPIKFKLIDYTFGSDIFTTELGFSEFSLPEGTIEMLPEDAEKFLGVNLETIGKERFGLKIGNMVYGIRFIRLLANDCYQQEITNDEEPKFWKEKYNLYFEDDI